MGNGLYVLCVIVRVVCNAQTEWASPFVLHSVHQPFCTMIIHSHACPTLIINSSPFLSMFMLFATCNNTSHQTT